MAPTVVGRNNSIESAVSLTHTCALPDGSNTVGRRLMAWFASDGGQSSIAFPAGWNEVFILGSAAAAIRTAFWYKDVDGTEGFDGVGDTATITLGSSRKSLARSWLLEAGTFDAAQAPVAATLEGSGANPDPPSLTPAWGAADNLWLALAGGWAGTFSAYPTNYLQTFTDSTGAAAADVAFAAAELALNAAAEDPGTFTRSSSNANAAATVAVKPAVGGPAEHFLGTASFAGAGAAAVAALAREVFLGATGFAGSGALAVAKLEIEGQGP